MRSCALAADSRGSGAAAVAAGSGGDCAAPVAAARSRFRPIVMTSGTFILGALPLIVASGAGATARKMLGLTVASGMLASTCIAVVFVPSFCVLLSRDRRGKS